MHGKVRFIIAAILLALLACIIAWDFLFWTGRFPPNSYIEKVDVSGYSNLEALNKLRTLDVDQVTISPIFLRLEGRVLTFNPSFLGLRTSPVMTIINSTDTTYRSNYIVDLYKRLIGGYKKKVIPLSLVINKVTLQRVLEDIAAGFNIPSKDATFTLLPDNKYRITKESTGRKIDIDASISGLEHVLKNNGRSSTIEVIALKPRVLSKPLVKYPPKYLLSEYTTYYGSHDSPNRVHNIKLSSSRTNNYIIVSGEVFSLLNVLGDFGRSSGYKEAFVLYNGELEPQLGGGSCQIASTFYNAALLAGLEIIERHNHGIYFTIYPLGRDASIYTGSRDLKVRNNTSHPVYIKAYATDKKLSYQIYGTPTSRKITFSRPMVFFEGEKFRLYDVSTEEAKEKINRALLSGEPFYTYVKVIKREAGYETERMIVSHYKLTGDRENVRIVRPEPD